MPRTKRAKPYTALDLNLPSELLERFHEHLTPRGLDRPPYGERQRVLINMIRDFCDRRDEEKERERGRGRGRK